jgi:tetrapyrrole methylase family protein / MazG family protein
MTIPQDLRSFDSLVAIIAYLRSPQGCPWDRKQTHISLREHLMEESYEVLAALDNGDTDELSTELGDLLMQIVMHARIGQEAGEFDIGQVIEGINQKLIARHPHVFGSRQVRDADEVLVRWEEIKKRERRGQGSMLEGVPRAMPALAYSQSVQDRVARIGFDWPSDAGVIEKLGEEIGEFQQAGNQAHKVEEMGDILFTLANYARRQGIDLEAALRQANQKFYQRFVFMEELCRQRDLDLAKMTLEEQNALWDEAKQAVREDKNGT